MYEVNGYIINVGYDIVTGQYIAQGITKNDPNRWFFAPVPQFITKDELIDWLLRITDMEMAE